MKFSEPEQFFIAMALCVIIIMLFVIGSVCNNIAPP